MRFWAAGRAWQFVTAPFHCFTSFHLLLFFSLHTGNSLGRLWEHASEQTSERAEQHSLSFYMYFLFSSLLFSFVDTIPLLYTYIY
jgi:hypothetical protein